MKQSALQRRPFLVGAGLGLGVLAASSTTSLAQRRGVAGIALPVTGFNRATGEAIFGTFTPISAVVGAGGVPLIQGLLNIVGGGAQAVLLPITTQQATCNVLDLELGPLDLNLLGLEVHLNRIHLVIEANPQGGLLGQLLCAIANLLSGGTGAVGQLVGLLNQLLGLFG